MKDSVFLLAESCLEFSSPDSNIQPLSATLFTSYPSQATLTLFTGNVLEHFLHKNCAEKFPSLLKKNAVLSVYFMHLLNLFQSQERKNREKNP